MRSVITSLTTLSLLACMDSAPPAPDDNLPPSSVGALETATPIAPPELRPNPPRGFSWVEDDLGAMAWPGSGTQLDESARWLSDEGVDLIVTLTEHELDPAFVKARGLRTLHIPVVDFTPPTLAQIDQFVAATSAALARDQRVVVHCAGGRGRTGTMLAAWMVANGATAEEAITKVRAMRPGSIETAAQEAIVHTFADTIDD